MHRRDFLLSTTAATVGLAFGTRPATAAEFVSRRPAPGKRKFVSAAVEAKIAEVRSAIKDPELAWLFENCYPNTLDTTVEFGRRDSKPDSFVITGDIHALWLRDSTAQVYPYLPLAKSDPALREMISGLIHRQAYCVLLDPYANAFLKDPDEKGWDDEPKNKPGVHERKWEVDSLCNVIRLSYGYYAATGDAGVFDDEWREAMSLIVRTFRTEQMKDGKSPYWFRRRTTVMIDAPPFDGTGNPVRPCGLIRSAFRPSDDSTNLPFLIPSNMFAVVELRHLAELCRTAVRQPDLAKAALDLAGEVDDAIRRFAVAEHLNFGKVFAYEVDGFGNRLFMDDANVPNLMSIPYLGYLKGSDPVYRNTRRFVLSDGNPYFSRGSAAEGQGSPHTGKRSIWPIGIVMRAMTSDNDAEILGALRMLKATHDGTGFMHESFDPDDPKRFTRKWFAWANTLFGELIVKIHHERRHLLGREI